MPAGRSRAPLRGGPLPTPLPIRTVGDAQDLAFIEASGPSRDLAQRFADDGARVYLTGRRGDELEASAEEVGSDAVAVPCDVS
jgi:hypothetical protein